jgi:peptidoglycan/xylan/chitin deacetylase (PgdA/CDA1 family)
MIIKIGAPLHLAAAACVTLAALLFATVAASQSIAFTFDDGPVMADKTGLSAAERNAAILGQLADAHLKSILFVTRTDTDKARNDLIREWGKGGHQIGNHTATHPDFEKVSLHDFEQELLTCDKAIRMLSPGRTLQAAWL